MSRIVLTAKVEDAEKWEEGYRLAVPMLRSAAKVSKPIQFSTDTETNEVCITVEPDDMEHYLNFVQSPEVAAAMKKNGVLEETVRLYILNKHID